MGLGFDLKHAVQRRAADAQDFGGVELVATTGEEDGVDMLMDDFIQGDHADFAAVMRDGLGNFPEHRVEILSVQNRIGCEEHEALNRRL